MKRRNLFKAIPALVAGLFGVKMVKAVVKPVGPAVGQVWLSRGHDIMPQFGGLHIIHCKAPFNSNEWCVVSYMVDSSCRSDNLYGQSVKKWTQEKLVKALPTWEYLGTLREFVGRGRKLGM